MRGGKHLPHRPLEVGGCWEVWDKVLGADIRACPGSSASSASKVLSPRVAGLGPHQWRGVLAAAVLEAVRHPTGQRRYWVQARSSLTSSTGLMRGWEWEEEEWGGRWGQETMDLDLLPAGSGAWKIRSSGMERWGSNETLHAQILLRCWIFPAPLMPSSSLLCQQV